MARPKRDKSYDVFVSYNHGERENARLIADFLSAERIRVWFDEKALHPGDVWSAEIEEIIATVKCALILIGKAGLGHWSEKEARALLDQRNVRIIPVILPGVVGEPQRPLFLSQHAPLDLRSGITVERLRSLADTVRPRATSERSRAAAARPLLPNPQFHYGGVVPPDFFIGRTDELLFAEEIVRSRQNFLLVGERRAGKTSFCEALIHRVMGRTGNTILIGKLNLESCESLTISTFLGHTLLNMIGEIARQVFGCQYSELLSADSAAKRRLANDSAFPALLNVHRLVLDRIRTTPGTAQSELLPQEFLRFTEELLELITARGWSNYLMIYDEANHLAKGLSIDLLMNNLESLTTARLTTAYAASPEMEVSFDGLSAYLLRKVHLGAFGSPLEMRQLLSRYVHGDMNRVDDLPITRRGEQMVWEISNGTPFRIQCLFAYSFAEARRAGELCVTHRHVGDAWLMLQKEFSAYFPRPRQ